MLAVLHRVESYFYNVVLQKNSSVDEFLNNSIKKPYYFNNNRYVCIYLIVPTLQLNTTYKSKMTMDLY